MYLYHTYPKINPTCFDTFDTSNAICKKYYSHRRIRLGLLAGVKNLFWKNKIDSNSSPHYLDPDFIVLESMEKETRFAQLDMFMDQEKNSFAYVDIAKYIRKHWTDNHMSPYAEEITNYLEELWVKIKTNSSNKNINGLSKIKYWFFEFLPLVSNGEQIIFDLVASIKLSGMESELLNGIYLMEPVKLSQFYPEFLIRVSNSSSFNLWDRTGSFYLNFLIIKKLYKHGHNVFANPILKDFWSCSSNAHYAKIITDKIPMKLDFKILINNNLVPCVIPVSTLSPKF